jgi:hypothetical protein
MFKYKQLTEFLIPVSEKRLISERRYIEKYWIESTVMRRIKTFRSTTDRIYDGVPIIL